LGEFVGGGSSVSKRVFVGRWMALFLLAAANLGLILIVAGGFTSLTDVIAPLTGHLIGVGLAASFALIVRRRMVALLTAGIAVTVGLHAWLGLGRCCRAPIPVAEAGITRVAANVPGQALTVLALNAWHQHGDPERLERYLAAATADVVVLSEFGPNKQPLLATLKRIYPFQVDCADEWPCSLALLSRLPFEAAGAIRNAADMPAFVWARLNGHLTIVGTHLHRPSRDPWLHERQMSALAQFIRRIDGPIVLSGDLNTSPWSSSFRMLRSVTGLTPASVLMPTWPAWPLAVPQMALDHVFVSPELAVTTAGTGPAVGSDHLPVWARLERRPTLLDRGPSPVRRLTSRLAAARPHLGSQLLADLGGEHGGARDLRR
jgi:endonuclease/exonuclease/phosphatase (EEP) superfamily protein YafD